jgi:deferrochelatase/peroxidase EfeB
MSENAALLGAEARRDIQGFITSGYGHLPLAAYLLVRIADQSAARRWIGAMIETISTAAPWPRGAAGAVVKPATTVNLAFTAGGLRACGLPASVLCTFPLEFQEGIASPGRSRILGDTQESAPTGWEFGGPHTEPVDAIVIVHALDDAGLEAACQAQFARLSRTDGGVVEHAAAAQRGYRPAVDTEPFGFRDGIAQPAIAGLAGRGVPTGEFILGYPNHYGVIPPPPIVPNELDRRGVLPAFDNPYYSPGRWRDLGRHGSFLVYRKLEQHVALFWQTLRAETVRLRGTADPAYTIWLASKMVGRWPSGAPLIASPDRDDPRRATDDAFEYGGDPDGLECPVGAHIRRAHPRDDLKPYPAEQSRHMSEAHRIIRRARVFGPPPFDPARLGDGGSTGRSAELPLEDTQRARGIHFFCVNASIRSQFEFIQQTWCNNEVFGGLSANKDPIIGDHGRQGEPATRMAIPVGSGTVRTRALPRVVTVRGGAYLFMPSVSALRFIADGSFA